MQILQSLNLGKKNSNLAEQLEIVLKLYKYVVQNIHEGKGLEIHNVSGSREEEYMNEIYRGVVLNSGQSITNVILFKHLLYMKGFDADIVLTTSKNGEPHLANLVKLGKEKFYFDPTLERSIFVSEQGKNPDDMLFCCAGLGSNEYSSLYTPKGILPKKLGSKTEPIPEGVPEESLPRNMIETIGKRIPDVMLGKSQENIEEKDTNEIDF